MDGDPRVLQCFVGAGALEPLLDQDCQQMTESQGDQAMPTRPLPGTGSEDDHGDG
ncbi:hypothetical protein D3C73_1314010 [compost metagenome]